MCVGLVGVVAFGFYLCATYSIIHLSFLFYAAEAYMYFAEQL